MACKECGQEKKSDVQGSETNPNPIKPQCDGKKLLLGGAGCVLVARKSSAWKVKIKSQQSKIWRLRSFKVNQNRGERSS